jgi:hypothetical protein
MSDELLTILLADLASFEADGLLSRLQDSNQQGRASTTSARLRAILNALQRSHEIAPHGLPVVDEPIRVRAQRSFQVAEDGELSHLGAIGRQAAVRVLDLAPLTTAVVQAATLPVTTVADEYMFIRTLQIFENLFLIAVTGLRTASTALQLGDGTTASESLEDVAARIEATPSLFRILTTMPRDAFSVIRGHTHGSSAIQSRNYKLVEIMSGRPSPERLASAAFEAVPSVRQLLEAGMCPWTRSTCTMRIG